MLKRFYLLFFIDVSTREVFVAARNLLLRHGDRLAGRRALVRDAASMFVESFDEVFGTEGIKTIKTPIRTPIANTYAKRWIETLRRELLDHTII